MAYLPKISVCGVLSPAVAVRVWMPLLDGSVLQILYRDGGKIALALAMLDAPRVDESLVNQLIEDHIEVAHSIASRYRNRGIDLDDDSALVRRLEISLERGPLVEPGAA